MVAPLDWGIGHATRCIPIIYQLLKKGVVVSLASDGYSYDLLKKEFPDLQIHRLKGYNIRYPKKGKYFSIKILFQSYKILLAIINEHIWLKKMQKKNQWDLIISDNRYGFNSTATKSIILTHQLHIFSGMGKFTDAIVRRLVYHFINRFDQCWIPDAAGEPNLAGHLSHPVKMPKRFTYIGPISRMKKSDFPSRNQILMVLSGPEPQRTLLENILLEQVSGIERSFLLVRGLPAESGTLDSPPNVECIPFLGANELAHTITSSSLVICRSGYSTVMDLVKMGKKAILIPTPGQTEQEYLAKRLSEKKMFVCQPQDKIDIAKGLKQLDTGEDQHSTIDFDQFKQALADLGI